MIRLHVTLLFPGNFTEFFVTLGRYRSHFRLPLMFLFRYYDIDNYYAIQFGERSSFVNTTGTFAAYSFIRLLRRYQVRFLSFLISVTNPNLCVLLKGIDDDLARRQVVHNGVLWLGRRLSHDQNSSMFHIFPSLPRCFPSSNPRLFPPVLRFRAHLWFRCRWHKHSRYGGSSSSACIYRSGVCSTEVSALLAVAASFLCIVATSLHFVPLSPESVRSPMVAPQSS
jgi:hypothetical protein